MRFSTWEKLFCAIGAAVWLIAAISLFFPVFTLPVGWLLVGLILWLVGTFVGFRGAMLRINHNYRLRLEKIERGEE